MRGRIGQNWKYNPNKDDIVKTETISGHMRPATNKDAGLSYPGNNFKANPIKHWRKQSIAVQEIVRTKDVNQFYDTPGATTIRTIAQYPPNCDDCANETLVPPVNVTYREKNKEDNFDLSDTTNYVNQCPIDTVPRTKCVTVCDPAHKARMAVRYPSAINTNSSKPKYYTSNSSYLQARCRTYSQNNFQYGNVNETKCGILNDPKSFRPNCQGCINCDDNGCSKISYYKPNNCKFAVQGAVSSSGRIARLKLDTVNQFAAGFNNDPNFGPNVANAYAYSGRSDAPYTIKSKNFVCSTNIGKFRRTGTRTLNC